MKFALDAAAPTLGLQSAAPSPAKNAKSWQRSRLAWGTIAVHHYGQQPSVTLSFNLAPGASLDAALTAALDVAVVGGLVFSQFLTLYITPTFYVSMTRMEAAMKSWRAHFA